MLATVVIDQYDEIEEIHRDVNALEGLDLVLAHEASRGREQPRVGAAQPLVHGEHTDLTLRLAHLVRVRPRVGARPRRV